MIPLQNIGKYFKAKDDLLDFQTYNDYLRS